MTDTNKLEEQKNREKEDVTQEPEVQPGVEEPQESGEREKKEAESADPGVEEKTDEIVGPDDIEGSDESDEKENSDKSDVSDETEESEDASGDVKKKRKRKKRGLFLRILNVIEWILLLAALGTLVYVFICTAQKKAASFFGYNILHVVTGSMEPTISVDDFILVQKTETDQLKKDDIIAYYSEDPQIKGELVIHRIYQVKEDGTFVTKGDANPIEDKLDVRPDQVLGKYKSRIQFLNWLASFVDVKKLLLLAVIIPMFLASIYEVSTIGKIVVNNRKAKKAEKEELASETEAGDNQDIAENAAGDSGAAAETEEEKIARWQREAIEEYRRTHPDGE